MHPSDAQVGGSLADYDLLRAGLDQSARPRNQVGEEQIAARARLLNGPTVGVQDNYPVELSVRDWVHAGVTQCSAIEIQSAASAQRRR